MEVKGNLQVGAVNELASYVVDTGSADAYAVALRPAITAYTTGLKVRFQATNANTGASTLAVNGLATKPIKKNVSTALVAGDIAANKIVEVIYDGTNFQLMNSGATIPASTVPLNGLTAAIATNSINNANFGQAWDWPSLTGIAQQFTSLSNTASLGNSVIIYVARSGAHAGSSKKTYSGYFLNQHSGTGSINYAAYFRAENGTFNYGIIVERGQVGIGTLAPDPSSLVNIDSTTQGFLLPRMTAAQAGAISSPAEGLMLYVTDTDATFTTKGWWGWDGAAWKQLG